MSEWKEDKLALHANIYSGFAFKATDMTDFDSGYPIIKIAQIQNKEVLKNVEQYFPKEKYTPKLKRYLLKENDTLIAMTGAGSVGKMGKMLSIDREYLINQRVGIVRSKSQELDNKYLYYFLLQDYIERSLYDIGLGAGQPNISPADIGRIDIYIPPIQEQHRIASILSAYDELIENNNRRIAILEQTAEQIYKEWFVRMRFPSYENTEFEKGVPKGWEIIPLGSISNILMGQSPKSEFYNQDGVGLPFHQGVGSYGKRFPKHEIFCSVKGRLAQQNDILFSVRAPVGRINLANTKLIIGRGLASIRHKKGLQSYLFYLLNYYFQLEDIIGNGSIFNSVGKEELNKFKILKPNDELDTKFNDFVFPIDNQLNNLLRQNQNLKQTRDLLLPRLISGKLKVKEAEKEIETV